jgi:hypothetical protein
MVLTKLKAHVSHHVVAVLAIGALVPLSAKAQEVPVFTPASAWSVGTTELSSIRGLKGMKLPCVVSNEFDNGYVVRFSGGGQQLLAMAVDFRQDAFEKGKKYKAIVTVGRSYIKQADATAFSASTLIFNLRPLDGFYGAIRNATSMEIDIDGNVMIFNLGRLGGALPGLEKCYSGAGAPVIKPPGETQTAVVGSDLPAMPVTPVEKSSAPMLKTLDDIVQGSEQMETGKAPDAKSLAKNSIKTPRGPEEGLRTTAPRQGVTEPPPVLPTISRADASPAPIPAAPVPLTPAPRADGQQNPVWEAKAGEDLKIVLSRWADRAGYDLQWQADQEGRVAQDIKLSGSFEEAVGQLLAESGAVGGISGHIQTPEGSQKEIAASKDMTPMPSAPVPSSTPAFQSQWDAPAGASLQTVLRQWSGSAGIKLLWNSAQDFPLRNPVRASGTFESAVQSLLDQYENERVRPLGQLNIDPETGQRTLMIDTGRS